jgi:protein TonB
MPWLVTTLMLGCAVSSDVSVADEPTAAQPPRDLAPPEQPPPAEQPSEDDVAEEIPSFDGYEEEEGEVEELPDGDEPTPSPASNPTADAPRISVTVVDGGDAPNPHQSKHFIEPLDVVMINALFSPDPERSALAAARTDTSPNPLEVDIAFCVGTNGKTFDALVVGNNPDVVLTKVVLDTIQRWRFKPFVQAGKTIPICSRAIFVIEFH